MKKVFRKYNFPISIINYFHLSQKIVLYYINKYLFKKKENEKKAKKK